MSLLSRATDFGSGVVQLVSLVFLTTDFGYGIVYSGGRGDDIIYVIANSVGRLSRATHFGSGIVVSEGLLMVYSLGGITFWSNGCGIWDRALWWSTFWGSGGLIVHYGSLQSRATDFRSEVVFCPEMRTLQSIRYLGN